MGTENKKKNGSYKASPEFNYFSLIAVPKIQKNFPKDYLKKIASGGLSGLDSGKEKDIEKQDSEDSVEFSKNPKNRAKGASLLKKAGKVASMAGKHSDLAEKMTHGGLDIAKAASNLEHTKKMGDLEIEEILADSNDTKQLQKIKSTKNKLTQENTKKQAGLEKGKAIASVGATGLKTLGSGVGGFSSLKNKQQSKKDIQYAKKEMRELLANFNNKQKKFISDHKDTINEKEDPKFKVKEYKKDKDNSFDSYILGSKEWLEAVDEKITEQKGGKVKKDKIKDKSSEKSLENLDSKIDDKGKKDPEKKEDANTKTKDKLKGKEEKEEKEQNNKEKNQIKKEEAKQEESNSEIENEIKEEGEKEGKTEDKEDTNQEKVEEIEEELEDLEDLSMVVDNDELKDLEEDFNEINDKNLYIKNKEIDEQNSDFESKSSFKESLSNISSIVLGLTSILLPQDSLASMLIKTLVPVAATLANHFIGLGAQKSRYKKMNILAKKSGGAYGLKFLESIDDLGELKTSSKNKDKNPSELINDNEPSVKKYHKLYQKAEVSLDMDKFLSTSNKLSNSPDLKSKFSKPQKNLLKLLGEDGLIDSQEDYIDKDLTEE